LSPHFALDLGHAKAWVVVALVPIQPNVSKPLVAVIKARTLLSLVALVHASVPTIPSAMLSAPATLR
jgi:hypothetical protein